MRETTDITDPNVALPGDGDTATSVLAPHQYESLYEEEDVPLLDLRQNLQKRLPTVAVLYLVLLVAAGFWVEIPRELRADFVLRSQTAETIYRFPEDVYMEACFVKAGQEIATGHKMMRVSSPFIAELIAARRRAQRELDRFQQHEVPTYNLEIQNIEHIIERLDVQRRSLALHYQLDEQDRRAAAVQAESRRDLAREVAASRRKLADEAIVSSEEVQRAATEARIESTTAQRLNAEKPTRRALQQLEQAELDLNLRQQRNQQQLLLQKKALRHRELSDQIALADEAITLHFGDTLIDDNSLILKAPFPSTISYVFQGPRHIAKQAVALKLLNNSAQLEAYAKISAAEIGHARPGMDLVMKVDTFPHYRWGFVKGRIRYLSLAPDETGAFPFEINLTDTGRLRGLLQVGMTGECVIQVENRNFWAFLLEGISRKTEEVVNPEDFRH